MPYVNCSVPLCVSSTRKTPLLKFHRLPRAKNSKLRWLYLIRNDNLTISSVSTWTSICSLHFVKRDDQEVEISLLEDFEPTLFPWSPEWPEVIQLYNSLELGQTLPLLTPENVGTNVKLYKNLGIDFTNLPENKSDANVYPARTLKFHRSANGIIQCLEIDKHCDENMEKAASCNQEIRKTEGLNSMPSLTCLEVTPSQQQYDQNSDMDESDVEQDESSIPITVQTNESISKQALNTQPDRQSNSCNWTQLTQIPASIEKAADSSCRRVFFNPYQSSSVLGKMAELWRLGKMCDLTLCIGESVRLKTHKLVLASVSPTIFKSLKIDRNSVDVKLPPDVTVEAVKSLLTYIYEGTLHISPSTVLDIEKVAQILSINPVVAYCRDFMNDTRGNVIHPDDYDNSSPNEHVSVVTLSNLKAPSQATEPFIYGNSKKLSNYKEKSVACTNLTSVSTTSHSASWSQKRRINGRALERFLETNPCLKMQRVSSVSNSDNENRNISDNPESAKLFRILDHDDNSAEINDFGERASPLPPVQKLIRMTDLVKVGIEQEDAMEEKCPDQLYQMTMNHFSPNDELGSTHLVPQPVNNDRFTEGDNTLEDNNDKTEPTVAAASTALNAERKTLQIIPIPDSFLNDSSPELQRRYMTSILERPDISSVPLNERLYECYFCPSHFIKARSCVAHVAEQHKICYKDVLGMILIGKRDDKFKRLQHLSSTAFPITPKVENSSSTSEANVLLYKFTCSPCNNMHFASQSDFNRHLQSFHSTRRGSCWTCNICTVKIENHSDLCPHIENCIKENKTKELGNVESHPNGDIKSKLRRKLSCSNIKNGRSVIQGSLKRKMIHRVPKRSRHFSNNVIDDVNNDLHPGY